MAEKLDELVLHAQPLLDSLDDGVMVLDRELRYRAWNRAMEALSGVRASELLGRRAVEVFPFLKDLGIVERMERVLRGEKAPAIEYPLKKAGLGPGWCSDVSVPLRSREGEILGLVSTVRDVTERRLSDETLRRAQELAHLGHWSWHASGRTAMSDELLRILGRERGSADLERGWSACIHPDDAPRACAAQKALMEQGSGEVVEYRVVRPDGGVRSVVSRAIDVERDGEGRVVSAAGIVIDVTEQALARERLQASEEKFAKAFEHSPLMMALSSVDDGKLHEINAAFTEKTGFGREVVGKSSVEVGLMPPDARERYFKLIQLQGGRFKDKAVTWRRADGTPLEVSLSGEVVTIGGRKYLLSIGEDVTEKRAAEREAELLREQLHQAQKLEAVGTLAGGIAHDFNNILGVVMGNAELLLTDREWDDYVRQSLTDIRDVSLRARELVKQILTFSRRAQESRRVLEVQPVVREAVDLLRKTIPASIDLALELEAPGATCLTDETQLHQVVLNLCTNAAQALGTKGRIAVSLREVMLDEASAARMPPLRAGLHLRLTVKDDGPGIPGQVLPRIFDPFFTTKEVGRGTGLGLAVVQGIVRQHRGLVEVESVEGEGATFQVWLPCSGGKAAREAERAAPPQGRGEHVLVVDDEPALARLTARLVESLGYHVTLRHSARETLEALRAAPERFDALVTDLAMPEMAGDALAREALAVKRGLPIILCTGYSEQMGEEEARRTGIGAFLLKPVARDQLARALRRLLDRPGAPSELGAPG